MTSTPNSGPIDIRTINNVFNLGNDIKLYRGKTWYNPDTAQSGNFPSNEIKFSDFYNKTPKVWPDFGTQYFTFSRLYPFGGCAGAGWFGTVTVRISTTQGISIRVPQWGADYVAGPVWNAWYFLCQSSSFIGPDGIPFANATMVGNVFGHHGRDTPSMRARTSWDGNILNLRIDADCKGGALGWNTPNVGNWNIPYTMNGHTTYSYGSNPDYNNNAPHYF